MSDAVVKNLSNVMSPSELAFVFETVVFHGAPWPMGPVEIIRVKRCEHCRITPAEVGPLCRMCDEDRKEKYGI